jgi:hypothetical protein
MTTHNDDAVREVEREQRAARRHTTSTPRNDEPTPADLTRELHLMETQVREYGYPGTRAVLNELARLRADLAKHRELLREVAHSEVIDMDPESFDVTIDAKIWARLGVLDQGTHEPHTRLRPRRNRRRLPLRARGTHDRTRLRQPARCAGSAPERR